MLDPSIKSMAGINLPHIELVWSQKLIQVLTRQTEEFWPLADFFKIVLCIFPTPTFQLKQIVKFAEDHGTKNIVFIDQILQNSGCDINNFWTG